MKRARLIKTVLIGPLPPQDRKHLLCKWNDRRHSSVRLLSDQTTHTFPVISDEDAGELASSGVFWKSVPGGESVRQAGDTESMSGVTI